MSNWLDYELDVLASSPSEINQIAERLKQPSTSLLKSVAEKFKQPASEISSGLKDLIQFSATKNLGHLDASVNKARRFSLSFKDKFHGIVDAHVFEVSEVFPAAVFLLTYYDTQFSYSGKMVIRGGEVIQQILDGKQPAQGVDFCLPDIFAPFQAEYYADLECGSLWQEWLEKMAAAIGELKAHQPLRSISAS